MTPTPPDDPKRRRVIITPAKGSKTTAPPPDTTTVSLKMCIMCRKEKVREVDFHHNKSTPDGYHTSCKICWKEYLRERREAQKMEIDADLAKLNHHPRLLAKFTSILMEAGLPFQKAVDAAKAIGKECIANGMNLQ